MRKLGISIYPDKSEMAEMKDYITAAKQAGFSRIFSCLLSIEKSKDEIIKEFAVINQFAKQNGFEIIVDVNPKVMEKLKVTLDDLSFFKQIHADGIRLDGGYGGNLESLLTFNTEGLKIELNMSMDTHYIDTVMDYQPNQYNLIACHNFYPHPYSGLGDEHFLECSQNFKKHGLRTAAFVCSQNKGSYGPWPVSDGLVTLERHRHLPLHVQIKDYIAMNVIDDIIISNCYPSAEELLELTKIDPVMLKLKVELHEKIPDIEKKIILEEQHLYRGDNSVFMIRSTASRVKYKAHKFELFNTPDIIFPGDIVIESSDFGHYAGELQIALKEMKNTGKSNVVGKVVDEELVLLESMKAWKKFKFIL